MHAMRLVFLERTNINDSTDYPIKKIDLIDGIFTFVKILINEEYTLY
jgi:hypothetical protein